MNSKELLEQAEEKARNIKKAAEKLKRIEEALEAAKSGVITIMYGGYHTYLQDVIDNNHMDYISSLIKNNLSWLLCEKSMELEQLIGIRKPVITIPVIPQMELCGTPEPNVATHSSGGTYTPDPVEEKLTEILQVEADQIEKKPTIEEEAAAILGIPAEEGKYPAPKKDKRIKTPENMTEPDMRRMYVDEGMGRKQIAEFYGVSESKINNFLFLHDIKRKPTKASKQPEETERPSQG